MKTILKKAVIPFITLILTIVATLNFSLAIRARKYTEYSINLKEDVKIARVVINGTEIPNEKYTNDNVKLDDSGVICIADTTRKSSINISTSAIDDILVKFDTNNYKNIEVYKDGQLQPMHDTLYMFHKNIYELSKESINKYSILIFLVLFIVLYLCVYEIKIIFDKIKNNKIKWFDVLLFILAIFVAFFADIYYLIYLLRQFVVVPIFVLIIFSVYILRNSLKENLHNGYLILASILGITMLFILPPFHVPDEDKHFIKSYQMSYVIVDDDGYVNMPESFENFRYKYVSGNLDYNVKYNGKNYFSDMFETSDYNKLSENISGYTNTRFLSVVPYIPSAIFIGIFRIIGASPLVLVLVGKLANLIVVVLISYYSIKKIPHFKKAILLLSLFPIVLHQSAAIGMDYLTNVTVIAFISMVFYLKYKKEAITCKNIVVLSAISLLLAYCKFGYFPVLLLVLLIPSEKFKNKKIATIFKMAVIAIPTMISYLNNLGFGIKKDNPYYSYEYAIKHPFSTLKVYYKTATWRLDLDLFRGMFDGFGLSTKWNEPLALAIMSAAYILLISVKDDLDLALDKKERFILILVAILNIGIIYSAMFFGWTYLGAERIDGLQPRYFIPAILCLFIGVSNSVFTMNLKNKNNVYIYIILGISAIAFYTITKGFYKVLF